MRKERVIQKERKKRETESRGKPVDLIESFFFFSTGFRRFKIGFDCKAALSAAGTQSLPTSGQREFSGMKKTNNN